jgi:hypothetical protein
MRMLIFSRWNERFALPSALPLVSAVLALIVAFSPTVAQTIHLEFETTKDAQGNIHLLPKAPKKANDASQKPDDAANGRAGQLKAGGTAPVWNEEWTIAKSASGEILGAWPADQSEIAEAFLRNGPPGSTIYKAKYADVVGGFINTSTESLVEDVRRAIMAMADSAVSAACDLSYRPEEVRIDAEVTAYLGLGGTVKLGGTWKSDKATCKK